MALAKAFPDTFMYEPHDPTSVSFNLCVLVLDLMLTCLIHS